MKHKKEITMPNFGEAVNVDRVKDFSLAQLKALEKLLDGKATQRDYNILNSPIVIEWNFTRTFTNTRLYPLHILKRLRTGTTLKESGCLLDVKKILWNNSHRM